MAVKPSHGYDAVKPRAVQDLGPADLELLVEELVRFEKRARHQADAEIVGRPPEYGAGADLGVVVRSAPRISRASTEFSAEPLTFDDLGVTTVFSVKSGRNWRDDVRAEAKEKSSWAVDALARGGHLVIVTSKKAAPAKKAAKRGAAKAKASTKRAEGTHDTAAFLAELEATYKARLPRASRRTLHGMIHLVDAQDLLNYLQHARPALSQPLLETLGVPKIPGLTTLEHWFRAHELDRGNAVPFEADTARQTFRGALLFALRQTTTEPHLGAIWIVSPGGVGKTRAVFEALHSDAELERRVWATADVDEAKAALRDHNLFGVYSDAILIVDDCQQEADVDAVCGLFARANVTGRGRLIVVTAKEPEHIVQHIAPKQVQRLTLSPLNLPARMRLFRGLVGPSVKDDDFASTAKLTEGYPWFCILLGKELMAAPPAGVSPAPMPRTFAEAVDLALCPRSAVAPSELGREVTRRVAALFSVMLMEGEIQLGRSVGANLVELFDGLFSGWPELWKTIEACGHHGLLRPASRGVGYRYVTPAIIEREIAARVLNPNDPDGGPRFRREQLTPALKRCFDLLLRRLEILNVDPRVLDALARDIAERLASQTSSLSALGTLSDTELQFAARHQPGVVAAELRRRVEAEPVESLRADVRFRRSLVFALEATASRRSAFDDSEAALFRLARAENEGYANNATRAWAALFDLELNTTYLSPNDKTPLLEERLGSAESEARLVALAALESMLNVHGFKTVRPAPDGAHPLPTREEARRARGNAWALLQERMVDSSVEVSAKAAGIAATSVRGALRTGVGAEALRALVSAADHLDEPSLRKVRDALAAAQEYDSAFLRASGLEQALLAARAAVEPRSFGDRLRDRVGSWGVAVLRREDEEKDRALAGEGLSPPRPILGELDWLVSGDAKRAIPFAASLGFVDAHGALLPALLKRVPGAEEFLAAYLSGQQQAGRAGVVDGAIQSMRERGEVTASTLAIWRGGATPERLRWLEDDVCGGRVAAPAIEALATGGWSSRLNTVELASLLHALVSDGEPGARCAVDIALRAMEAPGPQKPALEALLLDAWTKASQSSPEGYFAYEWGLAAKKLIALGRADDVLAAAAGLLAKPRYGLPRDEVVEALAHAARVSPERAWPYLESVLASRDPDSYTAAWAWQRAKVASIVPAELVMKWIGRDEGRAVRAADALSMDAHNLAPLARALLVRFGPNSRPARVLATQLHNTPHAVSSLATFAEGQRARAAAWLDDPEPNVRSFAQMVVAEQEGAQAEYAAKEEHERRRFGA